MLLVLLSVTIRKLPKESEAFIGVFLSSSCQPVLIFGVCHHQRCQMEHPLSKAVIVFLTHVSSLLTYSELWAVFLLQRFSLCPCWPENRGSVWVVILDHCGKSRFVSLLARQNGQCVRCQPKSLWQVTFCLHVGQTEWTVCGVVCQPKPLWQVTFCLRVGLCRTLPVRLSHLDN